MDGSFEVVVAKGDPATWVMQLITCLGKQQHCSRHVEFDVIRMGRDCRRDSVAHKFLRDLQILTPSDQEDSRPGRAEGEAPVRTGLRAAPEDL